MIGYGYTECFIRITEKFRRLSRGHCFPMNSGIGCLRGIHLVQCHKSKIKSTSTKQGMFL